MGDEGSRWPSSWLGLTPTSLGRLAAGRAALLPNTNETLVIEGSVAKTLGGARWYKASLLAQLRPPFQTGWR
jgi:hypothetical protein